MVAVAIVGVLVAAIFLLDRAAPSGADNATERLKATDGPQPPAAISAVLQAPTVVPSSGGSAGNGPRTEQLAQAAPSATPLPGTSPSPVPSQGASSEPAAREVTPDSQAKVSAQSMPLTSNSPPNKKPAKGHYLQAGMFLQATNAEELKRKLEAEGLPVFVESRVQLGPFNDRKEAEQARERLKALGVQAVLVP